MKKGQLKAENTRSGTIFKLKNKISTFSGVENFPSINKNRKLVGHGRNERVFFRNIQSIYVEMEQFQFD